MHSEEDHFGYGAINARINKATLIKFYVSGHRPHQLWKVLFLLRTCTFHQEA